MHVALTILAEQSCFKFRFRFRCISRSKLRSQLWREQTCCSNCICGIVLSNYSEDSVSSNSDGVKINNLYAWVGLDGTSIYCCTQTAACRRVQCQWECRLQDNSLIWLSPDCTHVINVSLSSGRHCTETVHVEYSVVSHSHDNAIFEMQLACNCAFWCQEGRQTCKRGSTLMMMHCPMYWLLSVYCSVLDIYTRDTVNIDEWLVSAEPLQFRSHHAIEISLFQLLTLFFSQI